jgi:hypothetical protein
MGMGCPFQSHLSEDEMEMKRGLKIAAVTAVYLVLASGTFAQTAQNPDPSKWMCRNLADSGGYVYQGETIFGSQACRPIPQASTQAQAATSPTTVASTQVQQREAQAIPVVSSAASGRVPTLIVWASVDTNTSGNITHQDSPRRPAFSTVQNKALPAADQNYIRASIGYLSSANAAGTQLATIWAGASDGTSTLDDCHTAARTALAEDNARYSTYRATRGTVPPAFAEVDRHIGEIHKKSIAGLSSILSYWTNGNLDSISRGMDQYKAAIVEMNSTIAEGTAVTKEEAR